MDYIAALPRVMFLLGQSAGSLQRLTDVVVQMHTELAEDGLTTEALAARLKVQLQESLLALKAAKEVIASLNSLLKALDS